MFKLLDICSWAAVGTAVVIMLFIAGFGIVTGIDYLLTISGAL